MHDQIATGHPGYQKKVSFIVQNYYWPRLKKIIQCYIQNCYSCKCVKTPKNGYNRLLKPLPISSCLWTDVILDFVAGLVISNSYNVILIVVDCLIKKRHYILYTINKNGTTTKVTAQLLLYNIWKLYGFASSFTSDKDPKFILKVWKNLYKILGIFANLFAFFYPKIDR